MKPDISHARLLELVRYNPDNGTFANLRRGKHITRPGGLMGSLDTSTGYMRICLDRKLYYAHRLAWLYVHGVMPPYQVDHINFDRTDNRICNLRLATSGENAYHHQANRRNTSGYRGVSWDKKKNKWRATIKASGKWMHLGYFSEPEAAYLARLDATKALHGEFISPAFANDNPLSPALEAS